MRRTVFLTLLLATCCLGAASTLRAEGRIIYVEDDADGLNDGTSWTNAYRYLQDALADANTVPDANEIRIAQGTYRPDQGKGIAPMDRTTTFLISRSMTIKGGYAGLGAPDPNYRDIDAYSTVLTGDLVSNDGPMNEATLFFGDPTRSDNVSRVLTVDTPAPVMLEGLTVAGSYGTDGAGLYTEGRSVMAVNDCAFVANAGGGIYLLYADLTALRCRFIGNWSLGGGAGIACHVGLFTIKDCAFSRNVSCSNCCDTGFGGAFYSRSHAEGSLIENCTFIDNAAAEGGAIALGGFAWSSGFFNPNPAQILGCTMIDNHAGRCGFGGGAISMGGTALTVRDCVFFGNASQRFGGAISNNGGELDLARCLFAGNLAQDVGGGLFAFGRTWSREVQGKVNHDFHVTVDNCTFAGNRASGGRTIACNIGSPEVYEIGSVLMSNCILDNGGSEIRNQNKSMVAISYSDLCGGFASIYDPCEGVTWRQGNLDIDPLFVHPGHWDPNGTPADANDDFWVDGDYHLQSQAGHWDPNSKTWVIDSVTSPCIDAGDPNSLVGEEPQPNGGRINMGCYGGTVEASKSVAAFADKH